MTDLVSERTTERPEPGGAPGLPDRDERPADPSPALPGGVDLTRLIALARLTPAQALEICASLLADVAGRSEPGTDGRVVVDRVVIGADGRTVLGAVADGRRDPGRSAARPVGADVGVVLAGVADAARVRGRRVDPGAEELLGHLDRAVTELPVAGVPGVARMLQEAATALDRGAVRAELAALVEAVDGAAGSTRAAGTAGDPSTANRTTPARSTGNGQRRTAARRIGAWLLSLLVLAAVVVLEVAVLRDDIATDIRLLLDAGRSGPDPSAALEPDGLPVAAPAPAAAGSVTAVDLRPLAQCAPGAPCTLRLLVRLVPGADPQVVTWSYRIVHRCTGTTETAPGGTVTVPSQGDRAAAVGTVALPASPAVAVIAVTDLPAAAASTPVSIGSCLPGDRAR
jgi:hypothetical protein